MASTSDLALLAEHPFLDGMAESWLRELAACASPVYLPVGHRLFRAGAPAEHFWLLRSGTVALDFQVAGRGDVVIERMGDGSVVGWSWLFPPYRWTFGAVAATPAQAGVFNAARVRRLIADDAELGRELNARFMAVMAARMQAARRRLVELYAYPAA